MRNVLTLLTIIFFIYLFSCTTSDGIVSSSGSRATIQIRLRNSTLPAHIIVNNVKTSRSTPDTLSLFPGEYVLKVFLPGYKAQPESIVTVLQENEFKEFAFSVQESGGGTLLVNSNPTGAFIILDGIQWGQTPARIEGVSSGNHSLKIRKSGFHTLSAVLNVNENQFITKNFDLRTNKTVLVEHFSNTGCPPCPEADQTIHEVIQELDSIEIAAISYHPSFPSPLDPFYQYDPEFIDSRVQYYKIFSTPSVVVEGNKIVFYSYEDLAAQLKEQILNHHNQDLHKIRLEFIINEQTPTFLSGELKITNLTQEEISSTLIAVIVLDKVVYDHPPGTNGQTEFDDLFYKNISIPNGDAITLPASGEITLPISFDIDNEMINNYKLIVFAQNDNQEILESLIYP